MQHEAYRDQYATIFNNGTGVVALSISHDEAGELASWAKESGFPMLFASDTTRQVAEAYAAEGKGIGPMKNFYQRVVYVVGKDGRIAHVIRPFPALSSNGYKELETVIDSLSAKK